MKKLGIIICMLGVFAALVLNATSLVGSQRFAEWLIILFGVVIAALLILSRRKAMFYAGSTLFFSMAVLNLILLYVLTVRIGTFLIGTVIALIGLVSSLFSLHKRTQYTSSKKKEMQSNLKKETSQLYSSNDSDMEVKEIELPQMLDSIPQNEPQVEVELETYEEPVIALGNEKVKRAKRVNAKTISSRRKRRR